MNDNIKTIVADLKEEMKTRDKESRADWVLYNIYTIADYYATRGFSFKNKDLTDQLLRAIDNVKFAKALSKLVQNQPETVPVTIVTLLTRFVDDKISKGDAVERYKDENGEEQVEVKDKVVLMYAEIAQKILKKPTKILSNAAGINKPLAMSIMTVIPDSEMIDKDHLVRIYTSNINRAILGYYKSNEAGIDDLITPSQLKKVYKHVFGKDKMHIVYAGLATETASMARSNGNGSNVVAVDKAISDLLGNQLESNKKKQIREFVLEYNKAITRDLKNNKTYARRLDTLKESDYPNTVSIIKELKSNKQD